MTSADAAGASELGVLARRLADRTRARSEATIQADVRQLLLTAGLELSEDALDVHMETQVGDRRRIDVEVGYTVIEVERDLRSETVIAAARTQLTGYVATREHQTGQRYLGVLTDGAKWIAYQLRDGELVESTHLDINPTRPDVQELRYWLEGILATTSGTWMPSRHLRSLAPPDVMWIIGSLDGPASCRLTIGQRAGWRCASGLLRRRSCCEPPRRHPR